MAFDGKVAIITGAAVRLGRAQALALTEQGARLVIHYTVRLAPRTRLCNGQKKVAVGETLDD